MKSRKKVKLKDIADKLGISIATVSRVLNNTLKVKPELEEKIRNTVKELNYHKRLSEKNINESSNYYNTLIQDIRIRTKNYFFNKKLVPFKWERNIERLETSLLWSPSKIKAKAALVTSAMSHPYWVHQWFMLQKTRDKYFPNIELKLFDAQLDSEKMIECIKVAILEKFNSIIIVNHLGSPVYPGYKLAKEAKIPLIIYTTGATSDVYSFPVEEYDYVTVIKANEVSMGEKLAAYFAITLNGKGNIVIIHGMEESTDNIIRRLGIQNELDFWPEIKVIAEAKADWRPDAGYKVMKDILLINSSPNSINGVISTCDEQTVGVVEAIRETGRRKEIIIGSFDAALTGLEMIKNGDLDASVRYESELEGVLVLDSVVKTLQGERIPKNRHLNSPLVTKFNYKFFLDDPNSIIWEKTPYRDLPWDRIEKYKKL